MNPEPLPSTSLVKSPRAPRAAATTPLTVPPEGDTTVAPEPTTQMVAKIRTVRGNVQAKGFTFGRKQIVPGVPLVHAEHLKKQGMVEILEVTEVPVP